MIKAVDGGGDGSLVFVSELVAGGGLSWPKNIAFDKIGRAKSVIYCHSVL